MAFRKTHGDNPEKLLFLDIDGVLNSFAFYKLSKQYKRDKINNPWYARQYDLNKLQLLKEIHDRTKCTIVMSSSWRGFYFDPKSKSRCGDGCNRLKRDLKRLKIIIRYRTSNNYDKEEYARQNHCEWVKNEDGTYNSKFIDDGKTPPLITKFYERGYQINEFLQRWKRHYPKTKFAILDDDIGDLFLFGDNFVNTKWYGDTEEECGLTPEIVERIIKILNGE